MNKIVLSLTVALAISRLINYPLFAGSLSKAEAFYLQGRYSESLDECALTAAGGNKEKDKAYYLMGLNYLQIMDTEKAREKFSLLFNQGNNSRYIEPARIAYADSLFLDRNYDSAKEIYNDIVGNNGRMIPLAYLRLGQCALKAGNWQEAGDYFAALKKKYPLSLEAQETERLAKEGQGFFTVQVGCFSVLANARSLLDKLKEDNYDGYLDEFNAQGTKLYRVRVGRLQSRTEAEAMQDTLDQKGYPTKIFP